VAILASTFEVSIPSYKYLPDALRFLPIQTPVGRSTASTICFNRSDDTALHSRVLIIPYKGVSQRGLYFIEVLYYVEMVGKEGFEPSIPILSTKL
jgi:hypothetical protein